MDASLHGLPLPVVAEDDPSCLDLGQPAQNVVAGALLGVTTIDKYSSAPGRFGGGRNLHVPFRRDQFDRFADTLHGAYVFRLFSLV
jgi:hypothetical protein